MINEEHLIKLTNQVQHVLEYAESYNYFRLQQNPIEFKKTKDLIDIWSKNKKWLIERWGNKLIKNYGLVELKLNDEIKEHKAFDFADLVQAHYYNNELSDFIFANKANFFDNITKEDYEFYSHIENKKVVIRKGSKIIKSFKYFEENSEVLRELQDKAAMILQQDKIKGELCFSVHPLDFLSLSETTYNWRSCHSLDGEFRSGNLSYMLDECTFICYVKGEEYQTLPRFPKDTKWNSKKWRMLLFAAADQPILFAGRQYPFNTQEGLKYALKYINTERLINFDFTSFHDWYHDFIEGQYKFKNGKDTCLSTHIILLDKIVPLNSIIQDQSSLHFNDLLYSHSYKPYYTYSYCPWVKSTMLSDIYKLKLKIGYKVPCPICGQELTERDTMLCIDCKEKYEED